MRLSTVLKWTFGLSILVLLVTWPAALVMPRMMLRAEYLAGAVAITIPFSFAAMCCALTLEMGRVRKLMLSGIIASAVAVILWWTAWWLDVINAWDQSEVALGFAGTVSLWVHFTVVLALVMRYRMNPLAHWAARVPTIALAGVLTVVAVPSIWLFDWLWWDEELAVGFFVTAAALTLVGILLTMVIARMRQLTGDIQSEEDERMPRLDMIIWCPRCELKQAFTTGPAGRCASCGLAINVKVP